MEFAPPHQADTPGRCCVWTARATWWCRGGGTPQCWCTGSICRYCAVSTPGISTVSIVSIVSITRLGGDNVASLEHTLTGHTLKV